MKSARKLSAKVERLSLLSGLVVGLGLFAANHALAAEYYVATTGSDSNPGTQASPFATLTEGDQLGGAGDTVYIGGGTYYPSGGFTFSKSGTSDTTASSTGPFRARNRFSTFPKSTARPKGHRQWELAAFQGNRDLQPPSKLRVSSGSITPTTTSWN